MNSWYDPGKESDAANALIDQGVDVILQHTDSPAPLIAAEKRGVKGIGQASDMGHFAPKAHMFSVRDHWAPHYIHTVESVMNGTWKPEDYWGGLKDNLLQIVSVNPNLSKDIKEAIETTKNKIISGEIVPFKGPLTDNKGTLKVKAGESASDKALLGMNWYVKGIDAKLPN